MLKCESLSHRLLIAHRSPYSIRKKSSRATFIQCKYNSACANKYKKHNLAGEAFSNGEQVQKLRYSKGNIYARILQKKNHCQTELCQKKIQSIDLFTYNNLSLAFDKCRSIVEKNILPAQSLGTVFLVNSFCWCEKVKK